jgi:hypothetical protein
MKKKITKKKKKIITRENSNFIVFLDEEVRLKTLILGWKT